MCERIAQVWDEELGWFVQQWGGSMSEAVSEAQRRDPAKDYNVAHADPIGVLVRRGEVVLEWMQWGLPAREVVANIPLEVALGSDWLQRRAVVPMTGFYVWRVDDGQPFFYHHHDGTPVLAAAVHGVQRVHHKRVPWAALLTGPTTMDVAGDQGNLPVVLEPRDVLTWLDPHVEPEDAADLISLPASCTLQPYAVTRAIGSLNARGSRLIQPRSLPLDQAQT